VIRKRILIIDDNADVREMHAELLRFEGFDTLDAADGVQGLLEARTHLPDLVLLDLQLPRMDGLDVARHIKLEPATAAMPIICLSGYSSPGYQFQALAAGCCIALAKPCEPDELVRAIRKALSLSGARSAQ
jgi:two-component system, cell cycle response regulator DivK